MSAEPPLVLVTGVSGFLGAQLAAYALAAGFRVRGTVRSVRDERKLAALRRLRSGDAQVELAPADLSSAAGWAEAVKGCTFILHSASPVPIEKVKDPEAEVINPARDGVKHVMSAALAEPSVKRVVLTSSIAAVIEGRESEWSTKTFTPEDWGNLETAVGPYPKSKILAEREAWNIVKSRPDRALELTVINPGFIIGPVCTDQVSSSQALYHRLFNHKMPAIPDIILPTIDVRDVALAHLRAMVIPEAAGRRFLLVRENVSFRDVARTLNAAYPEFGIPTRNLPNWVMKAMAWFDPAIRIVTAMLGTNLQLDNAATKSILGMTFRDLAQASNDCAASMLALGSLTDATKDKTFSFASAGPSEAEVKAKPAVSRWLNAAALVPRTEVEGLLEQAMSRT